MTYDEGGLTFANVSDFQRTSRTEKIARKQMEISEKS